VSADVTEKESPGRWVKAKPRAWPYVEAACDAIFWVAGLAVVAWSSGDLAGSGFHALRLTITVLAVCAVSVVSGLLGGLYGRRYRRGVLDEAMSVCIAGGLMLMVLAPAGGALIGAQRTPIQTVAAGALLAMSAMVAARAARRALLIAR
jgi:hypothetical protein